MTTLSWQQKKCRTGSARSGDAGPAGRSPHTLSAQGCPGYGFVCAAAGSALKPIASRAGRISGFAMKFRQASPVR